MSEKKQPWIEEGYQLFAKEGPNGIVIEQLARLVGKNKSSFYHYFADIPSFIEDLLFYHISQAKIISEKESNTTNLDELIEVLIEHKTEMLVSRQLRIHRTNKEFEKCFLKVNEISIPGIIGVWSKIIGLEENTYLAGIVLQLSLENFFLQLTEDTLSKRWMIGYFQTVQEMVKLFKIHGNHPALNGVV